jgi:LemA protein
MEPLIPILIILAVVVLLPLLWLIINYNRMARLCQHIKESWSDIDVEMKRRYELIPNLVETVKGYAKHERETLAKVIELRNKAMDNHGSAASQAVDESALMIGVKRLFALAEAYPDLKANTNFLALQSELANTEDRIAAARRFFNGNVREMNQLCQTFPTNIIASMFGFQSGDFFQLDSAAERVVPRVEV